MLVGYADDHAGDIYRFLNVQNQEDYYEQRCKMVESTLEMLQRKRNHPKRQQVELFLDEEENLNLEQK